MLDEIGAKSNAPGVGGGASGGLMLARRCTILSAMTTAQTRENCSVQPTFPYAPMTCFHINSGETVQ